MADEEKDRTKEQIFALTAIHKVLKRHGIKAKVGGGFVGFTALVGSVYGLDVLLSDDPAPVVQPPAITEQVDPPPQAPIVVNVNVGESEAPDI